MELEKRKDKRIDSKNLPGYLKEIIFIIKKIGKFKITPIDVSKSGMSFFTAGLFDKELSNGTKVKVIITSKKLILKAVVVHSEFKYVKEIEQNLLRLGIKFLNNNALNKYQKLLDGSNSIN